jgi:hypothetical protein
MSHGPGGPASASLDVPELLELMLEADAVELPLLEAGADELPLELEPTELLSEPELPALLLEGDRDELVLEVTLPELTPELLPRVELPPLEPPSALPAFDPEDEQDATSAMANRRTESSIQPRPRGQNSCLVGMPLLL